MAPTNARFHSPSGRGSKEGGRRKGKKASQGGGDYSEHTFRLTTSSLISFVGWFFLPGVDSFGGVPFVSVSSSKQEDVSVFKSTFGIEITSSVFVCVLAMARHTVGKTKH